MSNKDSRTKVKIILRDDLRTIMQGLKLYVQKKTVMLLVQKPETFYALKDGKTGVFTVSSSKWPCSKKCSTTVSQK